MKARLLLAVAVLSALVTIAPPATSAWASASAQPNSPGESPSDTSNTPDAGGPANQPGTNTGGQGENRNNATPGNGATGSGSATPGTSSTGRGAGWAVAVLIVLALAVGAFVVTRQKRLHRVGVD